MYQYDQSHQGAVQDPFGYNRGGMETFDPYDSTTYTTLAAGYSADCWPWPPPVVDPTLS